jgi:hypothetical protein
VQIVLVASKQDWHSIVVDTSIDHDIICKSTQMQYNQYSNTHANSLSLSLSSGSASHKWVQHDIRCDLSLFGSKVDRINNKYNLIGIGQRLGKSNLAKRLVAWEVDDFDWLANRCRNLSVSTDRHTDRQTGTQTDRYTDRKA